MVAKPHGLTATRDRWVPWLILAGGFLAGVGWILGIAWLWSSRTWTVTEKVLATLLIPGGIVLPLSMLVFSLATTTGDCTSLGGPGQPTVTRCTGRSHLIPSFGLLLPLAVGVIAVVVAFRLETTRRLRASTC